jgi:hypothetical protein
MHDHNFSIHSLSKREFLSSKYQVLMNLCTNASHAMYEKGGLLEVRLQNADVDTPSALSDMAPGSYVKPTVSDEGHGILPEVPASTGCMINSTMLKSVAPINRLNFRFFYGGP